MAGGFWKYTASPGIPDSNFVNSATMTSADGRWPSGFSVTLSRPWLDDPNPPPIDDRNDTMFVSWDRRAIAIFCRRSISGYEVPCAASVVPFSWPVSSGGNSPLGMTVNSTPVSTSTSAENASA